MKSDLLLHPSTASSVKRFLDSPGQFLILSGPSGSGKHSLALEIGSQLLDQTVAAEHPAVLHISLQPNKSEISIDQIRQMISKLKLTTTGNKPLRRLVFIENGHLLGEEAQNSLLKTLEEPPTDTAIIMTVDSSNSLLPTITSRGQIIEVGPVDLAAAKKYFGSSANVEKAWLLADGLPGLTAALLDTSAEHELKTAVDDAKAFIGATKFERLIRSGDFTKNRQQLRLLIEGLQKVLKTAQRQALLSNRKLNQTKMTSARKQLDELSEALRANVSPKTIYLKLCLNLGL